MPASPAPHSRPTATTHEVTNQPPPLTGHDVADDPVLIEGVRREGAEWYLDDLHRLGRRAGSEEVQRWADEANRQEPRLRTHDRYGNRIDEVEFHPRTTPSWTWRSARASAEPPGRTSDAVRTWRARPASWCGAARKRATAAPSR